MIDQLPPANRLNEAILNDPEYAREIASRPDPKEPWSPGIAEFDLKATMLRAVLGELGGIRQAVVASGGGKPKPYKPFPAPRTAVDQERDKLEKKFILDIGGLFGFTESDF